MKIEPVAKGLDAAGAAVLRLQNADGVALSRCFVKTLRGPGRREIQIYRRMLPRISPPISPRMIGVECNGEDAQLYLEIVRSASSWPWKGFNETALVLRTLTRLHHMDLPAPADAEVSLAWDYDKELVQRGQELLNLLDRMRHVPALRALRPPRSSLQRLVSHLPLARQQALSALSIGPRFIHGDVHSGNVMLRRRSRDLIPVFLDWGRARIGHPLDDVSSWLQSLGYWVPEVKRRHDSLLQLYLAQLGESGGLSRSLRDAYWLSAASNVLAGAALFHVDRALDPGRPPRERTRSAQSAKDCFRILRRASATLN